jgi:nucleoside-diphosphate-sugar epimerase
MKGPSGIYNVGTGVGTTFNKLVSLLNQALGTQLESEYFEMPYDPKTYQHHTVADVSHAESQLGFKAKWNLLEAIRDYHSYLFK